MRSARLVEVMLDHPTANEVIERRARNGQPCSRYLSEEEKDMLRKLMGDSIDYDVVRVVDCRRGPLALGRAGAIVVGNLFHVLRDHYFANPDAALDAPGALDLNEEGVSLLTHEIVHLHQFRNDGTVYAARALRAQARHQYKYGEWTKLYEYDAHIVAADTHRRPYLGSRVIPSRHPRQRPHAGLPHSLRPRPRPPRRRRRHRPRRPPLPRRPRRHPHPQPGRQHLRFPRPPRLPRHHHHLPHRPRRPPRRRHPVPALVLSAGPRPRPPAALPPPRRPRKAPPPEPRRRRPRRRDPPRLRPLHSLLPRRPGRRTPLGHPPALPRPGPHPHRTHRPHP
jgi:hypothetical protein